MVSAPKKAAIPQIMAKTLKPAVRPINSGLNSDFLDIFFSYNFHFDSFL
jgi:hypothetical protein